MDEKIDGTASLERFPESAGMVVMPMADHDGIDLAEVDAQGTGVPKKGLAPSGIEQDPAAVCLDEKRQSPLAQHGPVSGHVFHEDSDIHSGKRGQLHGTLRSSLPRQYRNDQDQQDCDNSRFHGISPLLEIGLLFLEMLPFVFDPLHEHLEAFLATDVIEEEVVVIDKGVIDEAPIDRILQPIQSFFLFIK
jgi:hypothetical protein